MSEGRDDTARRLGLGLGAASWSVPTAEALADAIPGLRVLELAGRGGMGAVYRAEQTRLGRAVAVKILPPGATADPLARERFEREARVLSELRHPSVLQVHDFGALPDGTPFLVTEWAEGGDLGARMGAAGVSPAQATAWVEQIAAALDEAHARGIVHRDLKPANVLVRGDGSLALGDFGLARAEGPGFTTALTMSGVVFGTFDYMAPEQMEGANAPVSPATDVYALGVMTYRMLTGRVPRGVFAPASRLVAVPARVDAVIAAALATEPAKRPASAGEFARRLRTASRGGGRARRLAVAAATLALGAAAAVIVAEVVAGRGARGERNAVAAPARENAPAATSTSAKATALTPTRSEGRPAGPVSERKTPVLPDVNPREHAAAGGWTMRGGELWVDEAVGLLRLPVAVPADFRYDVVVEFTRVAGRHSVGVILPTAAGVGVFELDAWEAGLGGLQEIDGRDLRGSGVAFPASLRNGERQQVYLQVNGNQVGVSWNGVWRGEVELSGRRLSLPTLWGAGDWRGLGLCAWKSPTVFHKVEFRAR